MQELAVTSSAISFKTPFLEGGGELGELIRSYDWAKTPLGSPENWPQSLRSVLSICLKSNFPIAIYWGKDLTLLYNDAWSPIPGNKHPWALGKKAREVWPEIWDVIEPQFQKAFSGQSGGSKDALLPMRRHGYTEECYFDFTFTPVYGEAGKVEGVFNAVIETTYRIINERRSEFLNDLALRLSTVQSENELLGKLTDFLKENNKTVSFGIFYSITNDRQELISSTFPFADQKFSKKSLPFDYVFKTRKMFLIEDLNEYFEVIPKGYWPEEPREGIIIPIKEAKDKIRNFMVCGLNARRRFDNIYGSFFESFTNIVTKVFNNVVSLEEERKRAEQLAEIDKAKTLFFSNISHEFRTPLTLMLGSLEELLTVSHGLTAKERTRIETTHRNAIRLLRLVNNLLDFSRIEAGKTMAQFQLTDISAYTKELASSFRSAIEAANLKFVVNCEPILQPVYVDKSMWEKIVLNLLSNAFKYTLEGSITVSVSTKNSDIELKVIDTGVGIPEDELPKMFERFHRIQNVSGRSYEGSGIGLSLVSELVRLHSGEISVKSKFGAGAEFTVTIPTGKEHLPVEQLFEESIDFKSNLIDAFLEEAEGLIETTPDQKTEDASTIQGISYILIVDDNTDMREYLKNTLSNSYRIKTAKNGIDALQKIKEETPQLVLSDIMMPVMDGLQLLKAIRKNKQYESIPVILLTARAGEESRIQGYEIGADDYLVKPFSSKELLARITAQIVNRRKVEESEKKFRIAIDQSPTAIAIIKVPEFTIELMNKKWLNRMGASLDSMVDKSLFDAFPLLREKGLDKILKTKVISGLPHYEPEYMVDFSRFGKSGIAYFDVTYQPLTDAGGIINRIMIISSEVTELVEARKKVEESETYFRKMADDAPIMIWISGIDKLCTFFNKNWLGFRGREMEKELGNGWAEGIHPDDHDRCMKIYTSSFDARKSFYMEYRLKRHDGLYRWVSNTGAPTYSHLGEFTGYIGSCADIQEMKELESRKDDFIRMANHELKTPVTSIKGYVQLLLDSLSNEEKDSLSPLLVKSSLISIDKQISRLTRLMSELLDLSKIETGKLELNKESFNLNELVIETVQDILYTNSKHSIDIFHDFGCDLYADKDRIGQVLINFLTNAIKYSPHSEKIQVWIKHASNNHVSVSVKDYGIGIDKRDQEKIFERFYRAQGKEEQTFPGFGIGLFIAEEIIQRHEGTINLETEKGKGSVFTFTLPITPTQKNNDEQ